MFALLGLILYLFLLLVAWGTVYFGQGIFLDFLNHAGMRRVNFTGLEVPSGTGLFLLAVLPLLLSLGILARLQATPVGLSLIFVVGVVGFGLVGLADDCLGGGEDKGFRGHFTALLREKRLTSGALKAIFGATIALFSALSLSAVYPHVFGTWYQVALNVILLSSAANIINLFDLRPGRAGKVFYLGVIIAAAIARDIDLYAGPILLVVAAFLPLFQRDLKAQAMLGDTGANFLGAVLGMSLVFWLTPQAKITAAIILLGLQALSEKCSFSTLFERVAVLRWFDRLGRDL